MPGFKAEVRALGWVRNSTPDATLLMEAIRPPSRGTTSTVNCEEAKWYRFSEAMVRLSLAKSLFR